MIWATFACCRTEHKEVKEVIENQETDFSDGEGQESAKQAAEDDVLAFGFFNEDGDDDYKRKQTRGTG